MIKRREMRLNGVWRRVGINRVYELINQFPFFSFLILIRQLYQMLIKKINLRMMFDPSKFSIHQNLKILLNF